MKREWLKGLGVADELIDQIMNENGKDINNAKAGAEALVESYKKESEGFKTSASDWENKYNAQVTATKDYAELKQFKVDTLAKQEKGRKVDFLKTQGFKHPDLFVDKIDFSKATYDEDKKVYTGLDEQIKSFKNEYKDLFEPDKTQVVNGQPQPQQPNDDFLAQYLKDHPEMATYLK